MPQPNDLSRSLVALDQNSTIIAVVELSHSSWLVAGMLPGIERGHCSMARVPTIAEEDAKRPNRERDCLVGARTLENGH